MVLLRPHLHLLGLSGQCWAAVKPGGGGGEGEGGEGEGSSQVFVVIDLTCSGAQTCQMHSGLQ